MQYAVTVLAVPRALERLDRFAAHEALQVTPVNLHDLLLALRYVRGQVQLLSLRSLQVPIGLVVGGLAFVCHLHLLLFLITATSIVVVIVVVVALLLVGVIAVVAK